MGATPFAMPIDEFRILMSEALEYSRHMATWSAVFPDCAVYTYEEVSNNISEFFLRNVLQVANLEEFKGLEMRAKFRWSRDVLEYKRMLNRIDMSPVESWMNTFACTRLARMLNDDGQHQDHLAPDARVALLGDLEHGNMLLSQKFGMKPFPALSNDDLQGWSPYPGLSLERARELGEHHARIRRRASYRIERWGQLARYFIVKRLQMVAWIVIPLGHFVLSRHRRKMEAEVYGPRKP